MTGARDKAQDVPLFRDRARASSFGANAELYDKSRPAYPDAMVDDLVKLAPSSVLDVGCGTGLLSRSFLRRGLEVTGVEPDAQMAAVARSHGLAVEVATFEAWAPRGRRFDLVVSGQAWHWVDPELGARKAAEVLAAGGQLALVWNLGTIDDDLREALDAVYATLAQGRVSPLVRHDPKERQDGGGSHEALVSSGSFDELEVRSYAWEMAYTSAQWVAQLETHSDHHLMAAGDRAALLGAVRAVIDERGGSFTMHYDCQATVARRRPDQSMP